LTRSLKAQGLPPEKFADAVAPSMFSASLKDEVVATFLDNVRAFHPGGFRAMARASAEDQSHVLSEIEPTLMLYADHDVRPPSRSVRSCTPWCRGVSVRCAPRAGPSQQRGGPERSHRRAASLPALGQVGGGKGVEHPAPVTSVFAAQETDPAAPWPRSRNCRLKPVARWRRPNGAKSTQAGACMTNAAPG